MRMLVLPRGTCAALIRLLDALYKQGVSDARSVDDAGLCGEFIKRTQTPGVFGKVTDRYAMDYREWQLTLVFLARKRKVNGALYNYLNEVGAFGSTALSVLFPVAQDFYNKGLSDYNLAPWAANIDVFLSRNRVWWAEGLPNVTSNEFIEQMQMMCYQRMHAEETLKGRVKKMNPAYYEVFVKLMSTGIRAQRKWFVDE